MANSMKKMPLSFICEENGNWYIDLPHWPFAHRYLQMVAGADDLLDRLADKAYAERMEKMQEEHRAQPPVFERVEEIDEMFEDDWEIDKKEYESLSEEELAAKKEEARVDFYSMFGAVGQEIAVCSMMQSRSCRVTIDAYIGNSFFDSRIGDDFILYLKRKSSLRGGAHYNRTSHHKKMPLKMWLCQVTLFVCHEFPKCIAIDPDSAKIELR